MSPPPPRSTLFPYTTLFRSLDDGYFDLIILRETNLAEFIRLATQALRGTHLHDENVIYVQAKHIKVDTEEKMLLNVDGEYGGVLPGEFVNLPRHIEFFVPKAFWDKNKDR